MPLPSSWADALIARISVRYGAQFRRQYEGLDDSAVSADWAEVMEGVTPDEIKHGLSVLPADWPPNAMQFRAMCKSRPDTSMPALPAPNPAGLKRLAETLAPLRNIGRSSFDDLLAHHRGRRDRGEPMSAAQRAWLAAAEDKAAGGGSSEADPMGSFCPPPEHTLPPGMRNGGIARDFARELIAKHEAGQFVDPLRLTAARTLLRKTATPTPQPETTE